ncbi:hypothetical protein BDY24DRAFT_416366 [Mrakia frigida]|uniref:uncharacterized protein n=1 Tax=Mrakia frigida TaxID=29902 RepID=UPI003FCC0112
MLFASTSTAFTLLALASSTFASGHGQDSRRARHKGAAASKRNAAKTNNLAKRESGRMTYFGPGACGIVHQNSEWTVALNGEQLRSFGGGYPPAACGKQITITYGGKTATATVQDECPSQYCSWGQLDLSPSLFTFFEPESTGVFTAEWYFGAGSDTPSPPEEPTTTFTPEPVETTSQEAAPPAVSTTTQWAAPVEESSAAETSSTFVEPTTLETPVLFVEPTPASSPSTTLAASSAAPTETESYVDEDDDSLPWCDELPEEEDEEECEIESSAAPTVTAAAYTPPAVQATTQAAGGGGGGGGGGWVQPTTVVNAAPVAAATWAATGGESSGGGSLNVAVQGGVNFNVVPALNASLVCPSAASIVLLDLNNTILFNNSVPTFVNFTRGLITSSNSSLFTTSNITLPFNGTFFNVNGTQLIFNTTSLCFNATLYPVANVSSWTNFTSLLFGNDTIRSEVNSTNLLGLQGPINGGGNSTLGFIGFLNHLASRSRR